MLLTDTRLTLSSAVKYLRYKSAISLSRSPVTAFEQKCDLQSIRISFSKERTRWKCSRIWHYAKVCRSSISRHKENNASMVTTQLEKGWMISSVNSIERRAGIIKRYRLGNSEIDFLVDTGSDVNTLPLWIYKRVTNDSNLQNLKQATQRVNCYNNSSVTCLGSIDLQVTDDSASHLLTFLVLDQKVDPLIGVQSTLELNLLTSASANFDNDYRINVNTIGSSNLRVDTCAALKEQYPDVFSDVVGNVGAMHHISFDPNISPVQHAQRRLQQPLFTFRPLYHVSWKHWKFDHSKHRFFNDTD